MTDPFPASAAVIESGARTGVKHASVVAWTSSQPASRRLRSFAAGRLCSKYACLFDLFVRSDVLRISEHSGAKCTISSCFP